MKIRLHAEKEDIEDFVHLLELLEETKILTILSKSEPYPDRGFSKYFRTYIDVKLNKGEIFEEE